LKFPLTGNLEASGKAHDAKPPGWVTFSGAHAVLLVPSFSACEQVVMYIGFGQHFDMALATTVLSSPSGQQSGSLSP
jgi:hypothetical protein